MDMQHPTSPQDLTPKDHSPLDKSHVDVTMKWGGSVMGVERLSHLGEITIGDGEGASFDIADASIPSAKFALVTLCSEGVRLNVAPGMKLIVNGQAHEQSCFDLAFGEQARVHVGTLEFVVQYTDRSAGLRVPLLRSLDHLYAQIFSFAMVLQLAVIGAMLLTPHFGDDVDDDLITQLNSFDLSIKTPQKDDIKEKAKGKKAARHKKKEGVFGEKKEKVKDTLASKKGAPRIEKNKRENDAKLVAAALANFGLNSELSASDNVLGAGGSGMNAGLAGLAGASIGDASGLGGMGTRGAGDGGGGDSIGIGRLGSGYGRGIGEGRDGVDVGRDGKRKTRIRRGTVTHVGSLSKAEIQRVVRGAQSRIRHCYEQELQKNPDLSGKLVMRWTIGPRGNVTKANPKQSTLKNAQVSACVTRVVKGLRFPHPKGSGQVFVTYPWVFASR